MDLVTISQMFANLKKDQRKQEKKVRSLVRAEELVAALEGEVDRFDRNIRDGKFDIRNKMLADGDVVIEVSTVSGDSLHYVIKLNGVEILQKAYNELPQLKHCVVWPEALKELGLIDDATGAFILNENIFVRRTKNRWEIVNWTR